MFYSSYLLSSLMRFGKYRAVPLIWLAGISVAAADTTYTYQVTSGTTSSWNSSTNWSPAAVPDSSSSIVDFAPTAALTVNLGTTPETVGEIVNTAAFTTTISGTGAGVLNLSSDSGTPTILSKTGGNLTINASIAGTQGLIVGTTTANYGGLIYFATNGTANTFTGGLTLNGNALLVVYSAAQLDPSNLITINGGNLDIGSTAQTWNNNIVVTGASVGILSQDGTQTLAGNISGTGGINYGANTGTNGYNVTGTNTYAGSTSMSRSSFLFNGNTTLGQGQINFGAAGSTGNNEVFIYNTGVTDDITQNYLGNVRAVNFAATSQTGSTYINTSGNNVTWANPIISTGTGSTNGLTKTGAGSLTLGSSNPGYTDFVTVAAISTTVTNLGTTTTGGTLIGTGSTYAFGNGGALNVGAYGTLQLNAGATASNSTLSVVNNAELAFTLGANPSLLTLSGAFTGTNLSTGGLTFDLLSGSGLQAGTPYTLLGFASITGITSADLTVLDNAGLALDPTYGTNGVELSSTNVTVQFAAASEPSPLALLVVGTVVGANFLRLRHRFFHP
jgi:hypothetical protein